MAELPIAVTPDEPANCEDGQAPPSEPGLDELGARVQISRAEAQHRLATEAGDIAATLRQLALVLSHAVELFGEMAVQQAKRNVHEAEISAISARYPDRTATARGSAVIAPRLLGEATFIAALSALGYFFAFIHQTSYLAVYDVPAAFVRLELARVISAAFLTYLAGAFLLGSLFVAAVVPTRPRWWLDPLASACTGAFLGLPVFVLDGPLSRNAGWVWLGIAIGALVQAGVRLARSRRKKAPEAEPERDAFERFESYRALLAEHWWVVLIMLFVIGLQSASAFGRAEARDNARFLTRTQKPEMVVLATYSDVVVLAPLDRNAKSFKREFHLVETKKVGALKLENVGPLRPTD